VNPPFQRPLRFELEYARELNRLLANFLVFPSSANMQEINQRMTEYKAMAEFLEQFADTLATSMITQLANRNAISWRQAATQASQGKTIYQMLKQEIAGDKELYLHRLIAENATYIKTLPSSIAELVSQHIQREQMAGLRSSEIIKTLPGAVHRLKRFEIERLARTEVAKADTAITRVRSESLGLAWYQWETANDARVRQAHRYMDAVLVAWNDPPAPEALIGMKSEGHYNAGNIYNCRCVALPLVTLSQVSWPARVYFQGRISRLTQYKFALMSSLPLQLSS